MKNPTSIADAPPDLLPRLLGVWTNREEVARRRAFADWYAAAMPAVAVAPVPPLPGGDQLRRHWRAIHLPFDTGLPTEAGIVRDLGRLTGGFGVKRGGSLRVRPFAYPGRAVIGGIECLVGDSAMPFERALESAAGLQRTLNLPVTAVVGQRPGSDLPSRFIVWMWPATSGPWFWPGNGVPEPARPIRKTKVQALEHVLAV